MQILETGHLSFKYIACMGLTFDKMPQYVTKIMEIQTETKVRCSLCK